MLRSALSKVMTAGRVASAVFGLALVIGLSVGAASMALGANGQALLLGKANVASALTRLTGNVQGAAMQVINSNAGTDDTALNLQVQSGEAPMRVNSERVVTNLNADKVDGRSFGCPGGTLFHEAACIETAHRDPAPWRDAQADCLDEGRRLATFTELQTFRNRSGLDLADLELTAQSDVTDTGRQAQTIRPDTGEIFQSSLTSALAYRCAVPPS